MCHRVSLFIPTSDILLLYIREAQFGYAVELRDSSLTTFFSLLLFSGRGQRPIVFTYYWVSASLHSKTWHTILGCTQMVSRLGIALEIFRRSMATYVVMG
ncbi:hypothetical protein AHAS_Ahas03G0178400 [Arachis hypogaea]